MPKKKPLPPPPMAGDGSPEGEALALIKKKSCLALPAGYARSVGHIWYGVGVLVKIGEKKSNLGKTLFRIPGKAGADLNHLPGEVDKIRAEQSLKAAINKAFRVQHCMLNRPGANNAIRQKTEQREADVLALFNQYGLSKKHNFASFVSVKLGITARQVRNIVAKIKREISEKS